MTIGYLDSSYLDDIADAIRAKASTSEALAVGDMPDAIAAIPTGGLDPAIEAFLKLRFGMPASVAGEPDENADPPYVSSLTLPYYTNKSNEKIIGNAACAYLGRPGSLTGDFIGDMTIPAGVSEVLADAFYYARFNGTLRFPSTVTELGNRVCGYVNYGNNLTTPRGVIDMSACSGLTSLPANAFNAAFVTSVILPSAATSLSLGNNAFYISGVRTVTNLDRVTSMSTSCFASAKIAMSDLTLTNLRTLSGQQHFDACANLTGTISLPALSGAITAYMFRNCTRIEALDLGSSDITQISGSACIGCTALQYVVIRKTSAVVTLSATNAFNNCSNLANIYVPDDLVESYKTATNWSTYASKITPLSELPTT